LKVKSLQEVTKILGGRLTDEGRGDLKIDRIVVDSREIVGGEMFFALESARDGHDFVQDAANRGASAAVVSRPIQSAIPEIVVEDTLDALGALAAQCRTETEASVVAVSGSLGKTTTRELTAHCLSARFAVARSKKNYNNLIGLPLSIFEIEPSHEIAILELGINCPGEMQRLGEIARPDHAIITNIAPVHIEGLGSLDEIAREKLSLLSFLREGGKAFLCADDFRLMAQEAIPTDRLRTFRFLHKGRFFGSRTAPPRRAVFTGFDINRRRFHSRLYGRGIAYSAACALAVATEFGIPEGEVAERVAEFEGVPGRMSVRRLEDFMLIEDCYNASPIAVKQALQVLSEFPGRRKIAVLGDMLELGNESRRFHEEIGALAGGYGFDFVLFFGEMMSAALEPARALSVNKDKILYTNDFDELVHILRRVLQKDDVLLLKASRALSLERVIPELEGSKCGG